MLRTLRSDDTRASSETERGGFFRRCMKKSTATRHASRGVDAKSLKGRNRNVKIDLTAEAPQEVTLTVSPQERQEAQQELFYLEAPQTT